MPQESGTWRWAHRSSSANTPPAASRPGRSGRRRRLKRSPCRASGPATKPAGTSDQDGYRSGADRGLGLLLYVDNSKSTFAERVGPRRRCAGPRWDGQSLPVSARAPTCYILPIRISPPRLMGTPGLSCMDRSVGCGSWGGVGHRYPAVAALASAVGRPGTQSGDRPAAPA